MECINRYIAIREPQLLIAYARSGLDPIEIKAEIYLKCRTEWAQMGGDEKAEFETLTATEQKDDADLILSPSHYYSNYYGHTISHLRHVHGRLRAQGAQQLVFLAGDSSLDNKHWLFDGGTSKGDPAIMFDDSFTAPALNGYEDILVPPRMVQDVAYWCVAMTAGAQ